MTDEVLDLGEVRSLASRLGRIPKEFQRETRKVLRAAGGPFLADARRDASWSTRIPASLSLRVSLSSRRPGISIRAALRTAPHARVYEGILGDRFRHPTYGRPPWVDQVARPYLLPALDRRSERIVADITQAVDDVSRRAGLS